MSHTLSEVVAATVRAEAARTKTSQAQLAELLGVSQAAVSRRLSGATPFELDELPPVAELLGVPVAALIGGAA